MMLWLVMLFPLLGATLNGFVLRKAPKLISHLLACVCMLLAFTCALMQYMEFMKSGQDKVIFHGFDWIKAGTFNAPYTLIFDRLSGFMTLIVTGIGSLIHIYAGGYMHEEEKTYRFFAYLNLFVFMMLNLVLGDNMLVMFVGWEGVGLCSYLLIGYWFTSDENAAAGMKAFLVNRIGDIGFILGIFLTFKLFGTISFSDLKEIIMTDAFGPEAIPVITLITLAFFVAACGKSAQIPLYVWLPDAMAGPTPVSALIHAATMVTAGIYMMTRLNFLFYLAPITMNVIAIVGAATALMAASIALVQNDIKKVLAYSTVSQLGFMVLACGVGAFTAGFFHVFTHACFKALLFMGAGSVIVAMHHKQDMREMGGLSRYLPITHIVFLIGVLAIIGFPGLSGFFSKDEILWKAYIGGGPILWGVCVLAASFTSFYMVRLLCLTFYGPNRSDHHTREHLHETSAVMWAPLVVLAVMSIFAGYLGVPEFMGGHNWFHHYLEPIVQVPNAAKEHWEFLEAHHSEKLEWGLMGTSVLIVFIAAGLAIRLYARGPAPVLEKWRQRFNGIYETLLNKYWVDEIYDANVVRPLRDLSGFLFRIFDVKIIDGIVNGFAESTTLLGGVTSFKMSGSVHRHGMIIVLGIICLLTALVF